MSMLTSKNRILKKEIDLVAIFSLLWQKRLKIILITSIFCLFGILNAFLTKNQYQASTIFTVQMSGAETSQSLGGLASLAGIDLNSLNGNENEIHPTLYPKILYSLPFKLEILGLSLSISGDTVSYREYLLNKPPSIGSRIKKYTLGLPGEIRKLVVKEDVQVFSNKHGILRVTNEDHDLMKSISDFMKLEINEHDGSIAFKAIDENPEVSAQLASWAVLALQKEIIRYKLANAQNVYDYTRSLFLERKQLLFDIEDELGEFMDRNRNINSALQQNQLRRLEREYDMEKSIYLELAKQKEQAALQLTKDTPIFSIIDPVKVPNEKIGPQRMLIMMIWAFLGFILAVGFTLIYGSLIDFLSEVKVSLVK